MSSKYLLSFSLLALLALPLAAGAASTRHQSISRTPTVSIGASPTSVAAGKAVQLSWSSSRASSCVAKGAWSGRKALSGTQSVSPTATSTYTLTCTGSGRSASKSVTVAVIAAGQPGPVLPLPTTPTTTPTTTQPTSGFKLGQVPFAPSSSWNTRVSSAASYSKLNWPAPTGYNYSVSWNAYSPAVYVSSPSDSWVQVSHPAGWGYPAGTVSVRMPAAANGASGTDGELLVVDGSTVHNFWQFKRTSATTATASSYGATNILTGSGWGTKSPFLSAGIVAAGSSQMAGLLVQAETDAGEIRHALQLTLDFPLAKTGFVGEAISGDGGSASGIVQEGQRLAIPSGTPMPSGLSPLGQKVFRALQNYGAFPIDVAGGTSNVRAQANAYDSQTMTSLWHDMGKITPLLQKVSM